MKIIEVSSNKVSKLSEMCEDMLMLGGKMMHCLEELDGEGMYERRGRIGMRDGKYGPVMDNDDDDIYERRGRRGRSY